MNDAFFGCAKFSQSLDDWDTSNVENMYGVFYECPISSLIRWSVCRMETREKKDK